MGRNRALAILGDRLGHARSGQLAIAVVSGPGGIGKTRLTQEFLAWQGERVGRVLSGACLDEGAELRPLGPVEQLVRQLDVRSVEVEDSSVSVELRVRAIVDAIGNVSRSAPVTVIVLEDLHWADPTTLEFVGFAVHALAHEPVLVIVTHRDGAAVRAPLRRALTSLDRHPGSTRLALGPLGLTDSRRLVTDLIGARVDDAVVDAVVARGGGLTLFVEELAVGLRTGGEPGLPQRLHHILLDPVERCSLAARELLEWAAVCGQQFSQELLAKVAEWPAATLEKRLDELLDAEILIEHEAARGYTFRHALLHEAIRDDLRPMTLRRLHTGCARVLATRPDLTPGAALPSADLARRWSLAEQPGPALEAFARAGVEAADRGSHAEAARLAENALRWFRRVPADEREGWDEAELLEVIGDNRDRAGDHKVAIVRYRKALSTLGPGEDARARLWAAVIRSSYLAGDVAGAIDAATNCARELAQDLSPAARALSMAVSAGILPVNDGAALATSRTAEALTMARVSDDPAVLSDVLCSHALTLARLGRGAEARSALMEAEASAAQLPDPRAVLRPTVIRMLMLHGSGSTHAVVDIGRRTMRRADQMGVTRSVGQQVRAILADCLVAIGRWGEASEAISEGLAWRQHGLMGALLRATRVDLAILRGRLADAERTWECCRSRCRPGTSTCHSSRHWHRGSAIRPSAGATPRTALERADRSDPAAHGAMVVASDRAEPEPRVRPDGILTADEASRASRRGPVIPSATRGW